MNNKIRIGICGWGNLGRGVNSEIAKNPDMELAAVFSRRSNLCINSDTPVVHIDEAAEWREKIDVMILCGGSANDLPVQTPEMAKIFNTVDSFDTHAKIPEYMRAVDASAKASHKISIVSAGWDPGLFSIMKLYAGSIIPSGQTYAFWGKGVSQGHSDAVRRVDGVVDAIQYTIPKDSAMERIRRGETPNLTAREKHTRICYVVAAEGEDKGRIEKDIKEMPYYFDEYDTEVNFISLAELKANHASMPHGGNVIHTGRTGEDNGQVIELSLKLDSNPEFTASVLIAYARAAYRLSERGESGVRTVFDIPPILLSSMATEEAVRKLL
jgi:diaminopimelate dehydrogenase